MVNVFTRSVRLAAAAMSLVALTAQHAPDAVAPRESRPSPAAAPLRACSCMVAVGVLVPLDGSNCTEREFDFRLSTPPVGKCTPRSAWAPARHTALPSAAQPQSLAAPLWIT